LASPHAGDFVSRPWVPAFVSGVDGSAFVLEHFLLSKPLPGAFGSNGGWDWPLVARLEVLGFGKWLERP